MKDDIGKIPPQAIDVEESVLGAIIMYEEAIGKVIKILKPKYFYKEHHQIIYKAIVDLFNQDIIPDVVILTNHLRTIGKLDEIGGAYFIAKLTQSSLPTVNIKVHEYSLIIVQKFFLREIIQLATKVHQMAYEELSFDDILNLMEKKSTNIRNQIEGIVSGNTSLKESAKFVIDSIDRVKRGETTMFDKVKSNSFMDNVVTFANRETIYIAAPGKNGKTKVLIQTAYSMLKTNNDIAILWFSMEDEQDKILRNMTACEIHISDDNQKKGLITNEQYDQAVKLLNFISSKDMKIVDSIHSIEEIRIKYKSFVKEHKNKKCFLFIDNFKKCSDIARGLNENEKGIYVSSQIDAIRNESSKEAWSCIVVADHVNKSASGRFNKEKGYRLTQEDLGGTGRKYELLTQLVFVNKLGIHEDFVSEQAKQGNVTINGKVFKRDDILKKLVIIENTATRNFNQLGNLIHLFWDQGTMQWVYLKNI